MNVLPVFGLLSILALTENAVAVVPKVTMCRKCDSDNPASTGDDCGDQTSHVIGICSDGCVSRYRKKNDGSFHLFKGCAEESTCLSEWWIKTRPDPQCTEANLATGSVGLGTACTFCCKTQSHLDPFCNNGDTMVPSSLLTFATATTIHTTKTSPRQTTTTSTTQTTKATSTVHATKTSSRQTTTTSTTQKAQEHLIVVPKVTMCRICDSDDPSYTDDCSPSATHNIGVCNGGCMTRYKEKYGGGLSVQMSCAVNQTCYVDWWTKTRPNPQCTEASLAAEIIAAGTECTFCCKSQSHLDPFCNNNDKMVPDSLLVYSSTGGAAGDAKETTTPSLKDATKEGSKTTVTTTTKSSQAVSLQPMKCMHCTVDQYQRTVCQPHPIYCSGDKPLCMTSFFDDGRGNLTLIKGCAGIDECWRLWWMETQARSDCMGDSSHDPYSWPSTKSGECHYCCQTPSGSQEACNKLDFPTKPPTTVDMPEFIRLHFSKSTGEKTVISTTDAARAKVETTQAPTTDLVTSQAPTTTRTATTMSKVDTEAPTITSSTGHIPTTISQTTEVPTKKSQTTYEPITDAPTTDAPTTEVPTTEVPSTEIPMTEVTTTDVPATEVQTTDVLSTEIPMTEVTTTDVPATEVQTTDVPSTEIPMTEVTTTDVPTTEVQTTDVPSTEIPMAEDTTTDVPATEVQTTDVPSTEVKTTEVPMTDVPTTEVLTTYVPTTEISKTEVPTTDALQAKLTKTKAPTTQILSTKAPTTKQAATKTTTTTTTATTTSKVDTGDLIVIPKATMCRRCDNEDPSYTGDDCSPSATHNIGVCNGGCMTRYKEKYGGGLRIQMGCADNQTCYTDWWTKTRPNPQCTEASLAAEIIAAGTECTFCCKSQSHLDPFCNNNDKMVPDSLLVYSSIGGSKFPTSTRKTAIEISTTHAPTTNRPTTEAPTTQAQTTEVQTTEAPTRKQTTATRTTTTAPKADTGLMCAVCSDDAASGQSCQSGHIDLCASDQPFCKNTITFIPGGMLQLQKQCSTFQQCQSGDNSNAKECAGDLSDASTLQGKQCSYCCNESSIPGFPCNFDDRPEKVISFKTPPPPPTTTTTTTATTKPAATVQRQCVQCGDASGPCGGIDLILGMQTDCPAGFDYCMTDITQDVDSRSRYVTKRCVDRDECRQKWFVESSDDDKCVDFDPSDSIDADLNCHFCCTTDGCNKPYKPEASTLFTITG